MGQSYTANSQFICSKNIFHFLIFLDSFLYAHDQWIGECEYYYHEPLEYLNWILQDRFPSLRNLLIFISAFHWDNI